MNLSHRLDRWPLRAALAVTFVLSLLAVAPGGVVADEARRHAVAEFEAARSAQNAANKEMAALTNESADQYIDWGVYTACGGIAPNTCLPILLDVGTDNQERLNDPIYIGWRHARVQGQDYDDFVEEFISAVSERWPHVLLQWEDFAGANAARLLARADTATKNRALAEIAAAMSTFAVFLMLWVINWIGSFLGPTGDKLTNYLSIVDHFDDFSKGVIDTTHVIYYLSLIAFGLFLTVKSVDSERWRG